MICFKCEGGSESAFYQEKFPCCDCKKENVIEYNICPDCGWMWRSINGVPSDDSQMHAQDLGDFAGLMFSEDNNGMFTHEDLTEEEQAIMENINEHLTKVDKMASGEASMSDYVHKCIKCESTAIDVNDGVYICRDCDFEWEVVRFD